MNYTINISEVQKSNGNLRGFATVSFEDSFKISNITILESKNKEMYVSMPRFKTGKKNESGYDIYKDICHPITKTFREELNNAILQAFVSGKKEMIVNSETKFQYKAAVSDIENGNVKGQAKVTISDCFVVENISILKNKAGDLFVGMPNYKTTMLDENGKDIYKDICYPVTREFREKVFNDILQKYQKLQERKNLNKQQTCNKNQLSTNKR